MSTDLGLAADVDALLSGARRLHAVADELDRAARCSGRATEAGRALSGATAEALAAALSGNATRAVAEAASLRAAATAYTAFADDLAEVETALSGCRVDAHGVGLLGGDDTLWPPPVDAPARVRRVHRQVLAELARVRERERVAHETWQTAAQRYADGDPLSEPDPAAAAPPPLSEPAGAPAPRPGSPWRQLYATGPLPGGEQPPGPGGRDDGRDDGRAGRGGPAEGPTGETAATTRSTTTPAGTEGVSAGAARPPGSEGSPVSEGSPGSAPGRESDGASGTGRSDGAVGRGGGEPASGRGDVEWAAAVPVAGAEGATTVDGDRVAWSRLYVLDPWAGAAGSAGSAGS